jgi:hypothetical protein
MMGTKLATTAYTWWPHLPDRPFRLLVHMCLIAKDTDENPKFYGRREQMILALGLPADAPTSNQMVSRAVRILLDSGAIARATNARFGKQAEFWVRVGKTRPQVDSSVKQCLTPESSNRLPQEATQVDSTGNQRLTQESTQGAISTSIKENREESTSSRREGSSLRRPGESAEEKEARLTLVRARADAEAAS